MKVVTQKSILHIITDSNIGGAGRHLLTFLDTFIKTDETGLHRIDEKWFNMEVALPVGSQLIPELVSRGVKYWEVPHIGERSFSIKGVKALYNLLRRVKPDLVHTHASFSGRIAARLCGYPIVYTRHSAFPVSPKNTRFPFKQILGFINHNFSNAVIAVSPAVKSDLVKTGTRPEHITVIYNGVPPVQVSQEKATIRAKFGIPANAFVVSQIARLSPEKGHDHTLDAAKIWANESQGIIVVLAGSGLLETHIRNRIEAESITNVLMLGFVQEVEEIISITDVQINASTAEATSLSLLEGMSLGIPAVVTDCGGNPFVITHKKNGLVVPQMDSEALAQSVLQIKNNPILHQSLSKCAIEEYHSRFSADDMARNIEKLYMDCLSSNGNNEV